MDTKLANGIFKIWTPHSDVNHQLTPASLSIIQHISFAHLPITTQNHLSIINILSHGEVYEVLYENYTLQYHRGALHWDAPGN